MRPTVEFAIVVNDARNVPPAGRRWNDRLIVGILDQRIAVAHHDL